MLRPKPPLCGGGFGLAFAPPSYAPTPNGVTPENAHKLMLVLAFLVLPQFRSKNFQRSSTMRRLNRPPQAGGLALPLSSVSPTLSGGVLKPPPGEEVKGWCSKSVAWL
jgi:hypothetical protein